MDFPKLEEKILKFWEKNKIFEKSIKQRKNKPFFSFFDGPPFASGKPHYGHILATTIKDTVLRYWTMRGYQVPRRVGWDCHGLPVENLIEKELGIKNKKEIEKFGIEKFNQACRDSVFRCVKDFERTLKRVGRWADYKNAYATLDNNYIESVWWVLKQLWNKNLIYKDYRVSPYCSRCGTALSNFEVNQGYRDVIDDSIFLKFKIKSSEFKNTFFLVWTTTPWTLPGNLALAVHPKYDYVQINQNNQNYILIKEKLDILNSEYKIIKKFKGKDLIGLKYEPVFDYLTNFENENKNVFQILPAEFVSKDEGTGIVHIAPMYGEDDFLLGKKFNLPFYHTVDENGCFKTEIQKWAGQFVKKADPEIIKDLSARELLYKEEKFTHSYPFCWRCDTALLYYALDSWYIAVTKIKKELILNNKKIHWVPSHIKDGRFGKWLEEAKDWAFSRNRFWGAPLPIWRCQTRRNPKSETLNSKFTSLDNFVSNGARIQNSKFKIQNLDCGNTVIIGSIKDLLKQKFSTNQYFLLRHGQTIYQREKKSEVYPYSEKIPIGLTEEGIRQIQKSAQRLKKEKIDLIYSSDFYRAKQTAEIVAKELNLKINFDSRLRDINIGIYHGRPKEEYFQEFPISEECFEKKPKNGESWLQCQKRMVKFLSEIDKKQENKKILIVGHGDPFWLLEGAMKGKTKKVLIDEKKKERIIKNGEIKKLEFKFLSFNEKMEIDFHRPYIDEVKFHCPKCKEGLMVRTPEVFDCWFESGSMPYAQWHYPFKNKELIEKTFPANFIAEGLDQTRGWFYTLHVIAAALTLENIGLGKNQPAFKNVIVNGLILDDQGRKLSKKLGNYPEPAEIFSRYGADALRYFLLAFTPIGEDYRFSAKKVEEVWRKIISTLWHSYIFFETYKDKEFKPKKDFKPNDLLNKWIVSRLNRLNQELIKWMDQYELTKAARLFDGFIDDFSNWYIRRSRQKFQRPKTKKELRESSETLNFVLLNLSKLVAPFIPFISEAIYKHLFEARPQLSVHLCDWPKVNKKLINNKLEKKMGKVREIIKMALAERAKVGIRVRQPLQKLKIKNLASQIQEEKLKINKELLDLIKEEVNVKEIVFDSKIKKEIELDTKITPELKEEGVVREIIRQIQEMRKKANLKPQHKILLYYFGTAELNEILSKNKNFILEEIRAQDIKSGKLKKAFVSEKEIEIEGKQLWLGIILK